MPHVMQEWTADLTYMQQSVLITAVRGPDGIHKNHISKIILRWFRRCILLSAMEGRVLTDMYEKGGGSFTGPMHQAMKWEAVVDEYLSTTDEIPHHFQLHLLHAAQILGYKHPAIGIKKQWYYTYLRLVNDMHLKPEGEWAMDKRLGDNEDDWRAVEEVTAK